MMKDEFWNHDDFHEELRGNRAFRIALADVPPEERGAIPEQWITALSLPDDKCGDYLAGVWNELCPQLPRVGRFIRSHLRGVLLATMPRRYHYVRDFISGPPAGDWRKDRWTVLIYVFDGLSERFPYQLWYGKVPHSGDLPAWGDAAAAVLGDLPRLQDGFKELSLTAGILSIEDVHSIADRWIRYTDPDLEQFEVFAGSGDGATIPRSEWPDFDETLVVAEYLSQEACAIDLTKADGSGWGGSFNGLYPVDSVALEVEDMIGRVTGAIEMGKF
ncbi:hypothetical protein [Gordonia alkaliphila]